MLVPFKSGEGTEYWSTSIHLAPLIFLETYPLEQNCFVSITHPIKAKTIRFGYWHVSLASFCIKINLSTYIKHQNTTIFEAEFCWFRNMNFSYLWNNTAFTDCPIMVKMCYNPCISMIGQNICDITTSPFYSKYLLSLTCVTEISMRNIQWPWFIVRRKHLKWGACEEISVLRYVTYPCTNRNWKCAQWTLNWYLSFFKPRSSIIE